MRKRNKDTHITEQQFYRESLDALEGRDVQSIWARVGVAANVITALCLLVLAGAIVLPI